MLEISSQIRAARALLGWRQEDLAKAAQIGLATIARIEQVEGTVQGNFSTIMKIKTALEQKGVEFISDQEGFGVRVAHRVGMGDRKTAPGKPARTTKR